MLRKKSARNGIKKWLLAPFSVDRQSHQPDFILLAVVVLLLFLGLLFLSSASSSLAFHQRDQDIYFFVKQQILHGLLPGLLLFYITLRTNYQVYQKYFKLFFIISIVLLLLVFIPGLQLEGASAKSWIKLGNISLQTSELVKLSFILFLAAWLSKTGLSVRNWRLGAWPFISFLAVIAILIILQPDIGTLSIIILTSLAMYFVAGASWKHLSGIIMAGLFGLALMVKAAPYRMNRFLAFLDPERDPLGITYQIRQALIAVGSGGLWGLGLGYSRQKFNYLPEPAGDSVFAIVSEEIGFIFVTLFVLLFALLMIRGFHIVRHSTDNFAKLVALGIVVWLSAQIFINIASIIGLLPLTGVPLPFVSLGGTNLLVTLLGIGILANISRFTEIK
ncbi:putative lipid II flippase FtsW [bacterium]|jgi:cell division protein FtsW|nr:putative lipid II flippase FtsW [bacterium]MBT4648840.1 putative lipid II flippase FtsW [bacterium]